MAPHLEVAVPLDDFDLETAAALREHLRVPGMGETTTRYFRDKLAMRVRAETVGLRVPEFVHLVNDAQIEKFADSVPAPWVVKPRFLAGAIGIKKAHSKDELHAIMEKLGDERTNYVLERFVPGDIFHAEGITVAGTVLFRAPFKYGQPPMQTMHEGGVFTTRTLDRGSEEAAAVGKIHDQVIAALGLVDLEAHHRRLAAELIAMAPHRGAVRSVRSLELAPNLPDDAGIGACTSSPPRVALVRGDHFSILSPRLVHRLAAALDLVLRHRRP